jgi:hypothetical protein
LEAQGKEYFAESPIRRGKAASNKYASNKAGKKSSEESCGGAEAEGKTVLYVNKYEAGRGPKYWSS